MSQLHIPQDGSLLAFHGYRKKLVSTPVVHLPPSDAMNADLLSQLECAISPSPGIPPITVLPLSSPMGSPTKRGADAHFNTLGPDSDFCRILLALETLREKAPATISSTDEDILEWARLFMATWNNFELFIRIANYSFNSYPCPIGFETHMNQVIKYFAHFVSLAWDFGGPPAWREKYQLLLDTEEYSALFPPICDAETGSVTSSVQSGDVSPEDETAVEDLPVEDEEEQDQLEEEVLMMAKYGSRPSLSLPRSFCLAPCQIEGGNCQLQSRRRDLQNHQWPSNGTPPFPPHPPILNPLYQILLNAEFKFEDVQVPCISHSCGCYSSGCLDCHNSTYRPPLFPGWDQEPPVKPKFGPPTKASKAPAPLKAPAPKPIKKKKMGPPASKASKFFATETDDRDGEDVIVEPPRKRQAVPLAHPLPPSPIPLMARTILASSSFLAASRRPSALLPIRRLINPAVVDAIIAQYGPAYVANYVECLAKKACTNEDESESEQGA
ncbi:hypothetical protein EV421DRAFT_1737804 [Armillaria borealis]|uniref:Uncharacterized protein n=1 Tax=Armillaria borealis TaxID=47425 RepID=A0AA39JE31_9AGAR|nr:hypothetical protein EV421DRAFT_1737804 [Armillaria borealis]